MLRKMLVTCLLLMGCVNSESPSVTEPAFNTMGSERKSYIIQLADTITSVDNTANALVNKYNGKINHLYKFSIKGFSVELPAQAVIALQKNPQIKYIEEDGIMSIDTIVVATNVWGLDRINQRVLPLDNTFSYTNDGTGVRIYILDTGINSNHVEFTGRMLTGFSGFNDNNTSDCHGHGTHVAGTAAGTTVGVAKKSNIVPVRVLDCTAYGSWSTIISGIDWVVQQKQQNPSVPMVINMSIGGGVSSTVNAAVSNAVDKGVVVVVSAGNKNTDACTQSPASTLSAMTVGATAQNDAKASFSNFGPCVDIFAPGVSIYSAYYTTNTGYANFSGTSMSAPYVTGVAALVLSAYPSYTALQVNSAILDSATVNVITLLDATTSNKLLYSFTGPSSVIVQPPAEEKITLSATIQNNRRKRSINLKWTGAVGQSVIIYKNNLPLITTTNDGSHTDTAVSTGIDYQYKVCTRVCSNIITIRI